MNVAYWMSRFANTQCEAVRGRIRRCRCLQTRSGRTKWAYAVTADMPIVGISEGLGVNVVYWRSHFANAQCEAVRGRIPLY